MKKEDLNAILADEINCRQGSRHCQANPPGRRCLSGILLRHERSIARQAENPMDQRVENP